MRPCIAGRCSLYCQFPAEKNETVISERGRTHVSQFVVDLVPHLRDTPLDNVAEVLIVDVVVLLSDGALCTFLELILPVSAVEVSV